MARVRKAIARSPIWDLTSASESHEAIARAHATTRNSATQRRLSDSRNDSATRAPQQRLSDSPCDEFRSSATLHRVKCRDPMSGDFCIVFTLPPPALDRTHATHQLRDSRDAPTPRLTRRINSATYATNQLRNSATPRLMDATNSATARLTVSVKVVVVLFSGSPPRGLVPCAGARGRGGRLGPVTSSESDGSIGWGFVGGRARRARHAWRADPSRGRSVAGQG